MWYNAIVAITGIKELQPHPFQGIELLSIIEFLFAMQEPCHPPRAGFLYLMDDLQSRCQRVKQLLINYQSPQGLLNEHGAFT